MREATKHERQQTLRQLLESRQFVAQEEVVAEMVKAGYDVTQSSISRDFKELGVAKSSGAYRLPSRADLVPVASFVTGIVEAGPHMIVVKTRSGCASVVAEMIDTAQAPGIAGTIAGENTVFIALSEPVSIDSVRSLLG